MEEIEVGEYVRSNLGTIGKVTKIDSNTNTKFLYEDKTLITIDKNVYKHSKNIIELIEVGDYVNGEFVEEVSIGLDEFEITTTTEYLANENDIKSIVTKEQFEKIEYKLGDK